MHAQTARGRKGAALREAISIARSKLSDDDVICFQELEKVEMVGLQREVADYITRSGNLNSSSQTLASLPAQAGGSLAALHRLRRVRATA